MYKKAMIIIIPTCIRYTIHHTLQYNVYFGTSHFVRMRPWRFLSVDAVLLQRPTMYLSVMHAIVGKHACTRVKPSCVNGHLYSETN